MNDNPTGDADASAAVAIDREILCVVVVHGAPETAAATRAVIGDTADVFLVATSAAGAATAADLVLENVGYGTAADAGFGAYARSSHEWFLVLNDDVVVTREAWTVVMTTLCELPSRVGLWSFSGFSTCIHPRRRARPAERPPHGAALAIRTGVFRQVSGFDPRYFLYAEEVDLWLRLPFDVDSGAVTPQSLVHAGAVSSGDRWAAGFELGRSTALLARTHRYWLRAAVRTAVSTVWVAVRRRRPRRALSSLGGFLFASVNPNDERVAQASFRAAPRAVRERYRLPLSG